MRVGLIGPVPPALGGTTPGGVATHQAHLAAGLAAARVDVDVTLLATNAPAWSPEALAGFTAEGGFRMVRRYIPRGAREWLAPRFLRRVGLGRVLRYAGALARERRPLGSRQEALANMLWYRAFLNSYRPSVVHVQHPLERAGYVRAVRRIDGLRAPLVITAHSFFGEHADAVIYREMAPNLRAADRVIAVSPHIAAQAEQLGVEPARIRVIRSGIDVERFRPRERAAARARLGLAQDCRLVLFVGNLEPRKQLDVLLRAAAVVRGGGMAVGVAIVGSGANAGALDQTASLVRLARELGLGQVVQFVGAVDEDELLAWYAAADVFALPSSSEAQGIVALEAMAGGLPVVASAVGGLVDTIMPGEDGFLVPAGDVEVLARTLECVLRDAALRARVGARARARVAREFTWQRAVAATLAVYEDALADRGSARSSASGG